MTTELEQRQVRWKRRSIVGLSLCCLVIVPLWGMARVFVCWEESCSGVVCWLCDFHFVITGILLLFLVLLLRMAADLVNISGASSENVPIKVDDPWIPGTKTAVRCSQLIAEGASKVAAAAHTMPGAASVVDGIRKAPGSRYAAAAVNTVNQGARKLNELGHRFEHGRSLVNADKHGIWTFAFVFIALLMALFMVFGPIDAFYLFT